MRGACSNWRAVKGAGALAVVIAVLPLTASQASSSPDDASDNAEDTSAAAATPVSFAAQFEPYSGPPRAITMAPGAVDLDGFEPPIEKPPPPPQERTVRSLGTGVASYYGRRFHGRLTANGERFNMNAMTAAHKTLKFGTRVRVTNPRNGRSVTVRINDRGPFIRGRTIDLSRAAAQKIGMIGSGHARVKLEIVR